MSDKEHNVGDMVLVECTVHKIDPVSYHYHYLCSTKSGDAFWLTESDVQPSNSGRSRSGDPNNLTIEQVFEALDAGAEVEATPPNRPEFWSRVGIDSNGSYLLWPNGSTMLVDRRIKFRIREPWQPTAPEGYEYVRVNDGLWYVKLGSLRVGTAYVYCGKWAPAHTAPSDNTRAIRRHIDAIDSLVDQLNSR